MHVLLLPWGITPASADAGSGAAFAAFCKSCDAFGGQLHAIVRWRHYVFNLALL